MRSSRPTSYRSSQSPQPNARVDDRICAEQTKKSACYAKTKRGRKQTQPDNFEVTLGLPTSLPILDRELRAIEILLGNELWDLLANDTATTPIRREKPVDKAPS